MKQYAITVVSPPGYPHSAAFHEVAESIHCGLLALGHGSVLTTEGALSGRQHIVLGANLLQHYPLPLARDAILYNLEQAIPGSSFFSAAMVGILQRHTVWDYSSQNAVALAALGVQAAHVLPIGYVPELTRIRPAPAPDIDVLFCGSTTPRRQLVLAQMNALGLRAEAVFGVYGAERDALISRARLLLNLHQHDGAGVLEVVRIAYLLANRCAVLSETSTDPAEDAVFSAGVAFVGYPQLAQRARELVDNPSERARLSQTGFEIMRQRPMADYLRAALPDSGQGNATA